MPDLYVTPNGTWTATKADAAKATRREGSKPGSWKAVSVPTKKEPLIDFLNKGWKAPEPEAKAPPPPRTLRADPEGHRYRVYINRLFSFVVRAGSQTEAEALAKEEALATMHVALTP